MLRDAYMLPLCARMVLLPEEGVAGSQAKFMCNFFRNGQARSRLAPLCVESRSVRAGVWRLCPGWSPSDRLMCSHVRRAPTEQKPWWPSPTLLESSPEVTEQPPSWVTCTATTLVTGRLCTGPLQWGEGSNLGWAM